MALIVPKYLDSVVAIGKDDDNGGVHWMGTGFLFGFRLPGQNYEENVYSIFLVSNRHVLQGQDYVYLRFNPQGGQPAQNHRLDIIVSGMNLYKRHPNIKDVDVAVVSIPQPYIDTLINNGVRPEFITYDKESFQIKDLQSLGVTEGDFLANVNFRIPA